MSMRLSKQSSDLTTIIFFLLPSMLSFGIFVYYVFGYSFFLSATSWNFITPEKKFIGFLNYNKIISDPIFWKVLKNTFLFAIGNVIFSIFFGLIIALQLSKNLFGRSIFRTVFYFPNVTTTSAIAILWIWIFDPSFGLINFLLSLIGIEGPSWLMSPTWAMPTVISLSVWRAIGYNMVIFIGGLSAIPGVLYEAAEIDGASKFQKFLHVTLPQLSPTTFFLVVTSVIGSLQVFDAVIVMTQGGPVSSTKVMNLLIYSKAFVEFKAGYASALSVVFFLIILCLTIFQNIASKKWVHYEK